MSPILDVQGHCPVCGSEKLHRMGSGMLQCLAHGCPDPGAVHKLLQQKETAHILVVDEDGDWTVKHPLRERVSDELFECIFPSPSDVPAGTYREAGDGWEHIR